MRNFFSSTFLSKIMIACIMFVVFQTESTSAAEIKNCNIITDCKYSTSDYNTIVESFIKGIKF